MTKAHSGYDMSSASVANSICASELGAGWQMAEWRDGLGGTGAYNFQAYGNATHPDRLGVAINDGQLTDCWNSAWQPRA